MKKHKTGLKDDITILLKMQKTFCWHLFLYEMRFWLIQIDIPYCNWNMNLETK